MTPVKAKTNNSEVKMMLLRSANKSDAPAKKTLVIESDMPKKRTYKHLTNPEPIEQSAGAL